MAVLLDTDTIAPRDRADRVSAVVQELSVPSYIAHTPTEAGVCGRINGWEFGPVTLFRARLSGITMIRTPKLIRVSPGPLLAINVQRQATSRLIQADVDQETAPGGLFVLDFNVPFELDWRGGTVAALFVPLDLLEVPTAAVGAALARLRQSPLYRLVANHIALLDDSVESLHSDPGVSELGDACVEMVRALLVSAAGGSEDSTALPQQILLDQIRAYVRRHLCEVDLDAASIARAHNISRRYLYKVCADAGLSLEQWTISERLDRARRALARPEAQQCSITALAYAHGFRNATHFSRRFRAAYGMSPREWRRAVLDRAGVPSDRGRADS